MMAAKLIEKVRQARTVRLEIPDNVPNGKSWAPHQHAPHVLLGRVEEVSLTELPLVTADQVSSSPDDVVVLVLTGRAGFRRCHDVFYASLRDASGQEHSGLVIKAMDPTFFAPKASTGGPSRPTAVKNFASEFDIYDNLLAEVQGTVVPLFGGMFGRGTLYCSVYEDAGRSLTWQEKESTAIGDQLLWAVKTIHDHGVALIPTNWQNIRRSADGRILISDFEGTGTHANITPDVIERLPYRREGGRFPTVDEYMESWCSAGIDLTNELLFRD